MTRGARAAAAGIALLTLAGCERGEARGKTPLPPLSPSTTAATSAPSQPTPSPSQAETETTEAGVRTFVDDYFDATNVASRTGDTARWRTMITADCVCQESVRVIEDAFRRGSIRGLRWTVRKVDIRAVSKLDAKLSVTFDVSDADMLGPNGEVLEHVPGFKNARDGMTLTRESGKWLVSNVVQIRLGT